MDIDEPNLEVWRHEWIDEMESARFARLTSNQSLDEPGSRRPDSEQYRDREMSEASTATLRQNTQSRESTATIRGASEVLYSRLYSADAMNIDEPDIGLPSTANANKSAIIVATDFGTTFSSVAFATREAGRHGKIRMVARYPDDVRILQGRPSLEVPTESWYPDAAQLAELDGPDLDMDATNIDDENIDRYGVSEQYEEEDDSAEENGPADTVPPEIVSRNFLWGYGIHKLMIAPDLDRKKFDRIARFKLLLDTGNHTQEVRADLRPVINRLKRRQMINDEVDVIADYLTQLFKHAKQQIQHTLDTSDMTPIEHVLCVPIVWSSKALRKMQLAMKCAIERSSLGTMENLFLVSEPEAAAAYVLQKSDEVNPGEAFLLLDAGGGTVDATTYMVDKQYPLRLSRELVEPRGCLHGSSYLNEDFRKLLLKRLENENYLETHGYTIEGIVDKEVLQFENQIKRIVDVNDNTMPNTRIDIQGLKADNKKGFGKNKMWITRNDFYRIFMPHLTEIGKLMKDQLTAANDAGYRVQKVVLIGGFSGSPSLQNYLKIQLKLMTRACGYQIRLIDSADTRQPETAVAHGAVRRAFDKDDGPARITRSSYGFLRSEPHGEWPEHEGVKAIIDRLDGERYVDNTIDWLVKKGSELPSHAEYFITGHHLFSTTRRYFKCEEVLYVSDSCTESHYRRNHPKNKDKFEIAGKIIADMSFLVNEGLIDAVEADPSLGSKRHYKIELELVMIIDGRNLRYEARWPVGGTVRSGGQISIAAAFLPGTN